MTRFALALILITDFAVPSSARLVNDLDAHHISVSARVVMGLMSSAKQSDADSRYALGYMYAAGDSHCTGLRARATAWLPKAAAKGHAVA